MLEQIIDAAIGRKKAEIVLKNGRFVNVFTGEICEGDIAIEAGKIVGFGKYEGETEYDIAGKIAEPLTRIDKITIIGSGSDNGVESVADHVPAVMAKLFETMKETVGIDMGELVKAGTYDAAVTRNINITNSGSSETAQPAADAPEASVNRTEE